VEDPQADAILQRVAKQLARRGVHRLYQRCDDGDADLQSEQRSEGPIRLLRSLKFTGDRPRDFVEQQLSDPQRRGGHEREQYAEDDYQREETRTCGPHQTRGR
jgi:hypothetical protein